MYKHPDEREQRGDVKRKPVIVVGCDHAGFGVKEFVKTLLTRMGYRFEDVGTYSRKSVDYPDYAERVALAVKKGKQKRGILACGTGIGAAIAVNKFPGIYAAHVHTVRDARLSRQHNNANVLVLGGRPYNKKNVEKVVKTWLRTAFSGGRHRRRVNKIARIEKMWSRTPRH
jgi:ribose 5-phosphate isomerase B